MKYFLAILMFYISPFGSKAQNHAPLTREQIMGIKPNKNQSKSTTQKTNHSNIQNNNNQSIEDFVDGKYYKNSQSFISLIALNNFLVISNIWNSLIV